MYKIKIGILYERNARNREAGRYWHTYYKDWAEDLDISDLLQQIKDETQKEIEEAMISDIVCHVVNLGTFDCTDGKYFCGSCECYFDDFDWEVGRNCCPYCGGSNFVEGGPDDISQRK